MYSSPSATSSKIAHRLLRCHFSFPSAPFVITLNTAAKRCTQYPSSLYHVTTRSEILPVALGVLGLGAYYGYRALNRMDADWDEYQWELKRFEERALVDPEFLSVTATSTLAIDMGSAFMKMATLSPKVAKQNSKLDASIFPHIIVNRSGQRSWFNGVLYADNQEKCNHEMTDQTVLLRGSAAMEQWYFSDQQSEPTDRDSSESSRDESSRVTLPWNEMVKITNDENQRNRHSALSRQVIDSLCPWVNDAWTTWMVASNDVNPTPTLNVKRIVMTVPVPLHHVISPHTLVELKKAVETAEDRESETYIVPDPVAAVWGAQQAKLIRFPMDNEMVQSKSKTVSFSAFPKVLVIDVGAQITQIAVVRNDIVQSSVLIQFGGETLVTRFVDVLRNAATVSRPHSPLRDLRSLCSLHNHARSILPTLVRSSGNHRVHVVVPYLFPDPGDHHLETVVTCQQLEESIERTVLSSLVPSIRNTGNDSRMLSSHLPSPVDLLSLWMSLLTCVIETTASLNVPSEVDYVLLIGGGSKASLIERTIVQACEAVFGYEATQQKLVLPDSDLRTELVVRGAASMLPFYMYDSERGLYRRD
jgi:hypothetical protein